MHEELTVVDLFCGAGGLSEGFRQAGYRVLAGCDFDPDACATYAVNFPEGRAICGDLRDASVRSRLNECISTDIDVVVGGPPCQAFSQMRNHSRLIDDPRNSLYREFVRFLNRFEPRAFVMENVPGLEQMGVKEQVIEDLTLSGQYSVRAQVVDAVDFGVPQTRRRVLFVGVHTSLDVDAPLLLGTGASSGFGLQRCVRSTRVEYRVRLDRDLFLRPEALQDPAEASIVTAKQAIGDLEFLQAGDRRDSVDVTRLPSASSSYQVLMRAGLGAQLGNVSVPRINEDTKLRLKRLPPGGNFRDLPEELTDRYLTGALWGPSNGSGKLGRQHFYAYRRLHDGIWSWTLNTKADSVYHYKKLRALSVREFARLQSFPDRFVFTTDPRTGRLPGRIDGGAAHSRYRQVGNAVPPLLARAVARGVAAVLTETSVSLTA